MENEIPSAGLAPATDIDALIDEILASDAELQAGAMLRANQLRVLGEQITADFVEALQHKENTNITTRLDNCARLRRGEYEPHILAEIRKFGGSELYFNLIGSKAESGEAWINDGLSPETYKPELEATDIPDLAQSDLVAIMEQVDQQAAASAATGQILTPGAMQELQQKTIADRQKLAVEEAEEKAKGMTEKIRDQYLEGGFSGALKEFVNHFTTYPSAFLCWPEIRPKKRMAWGGDGTPQVKIDFIETARSPSPYDMYPAPNAADLETGPLIEAFNIGRDELEAMIGQEGWNEDEIRAVLASGSQPRNVRNYLPGENQREEEENRDFSRNEGVAQGVYCGLKYYAAAREGTMFADGAQIEALLIGEYVVQARLNPHPLGIRPYRCSSYKKLPGSPWGVALCEDGEAAQNAANALARNAIDNFAYASGPIIFIDSYSTDKASIPKDKDTGNLVVRPRMVAFYDSSRLKDAGSKPFHFVEIPNNVALFLQGFEFFSNMIDDITRIPRYIQGDADVRGAGATASGFAMLMGNAGKGLRELISNIQIDVLDPHLESTYAWNLEYLANSEWAHIKGDCRVKPTGPLQVMNREITDMRHGEMVQMSMTPQDIMRIIGDAGGAKVLRPLYERIGIKHAVPTDEQMEMREEQQALAMRQQAILDQELHGGAAMNGKAPKSGSAGNRQPTAPIPDAALMEVS